MKLLPSQTIAIQLILATFLLLSSSVSVLFATAGAPASRNKRSAASIEPGASPNGSHVDVASTSDQITASTIEGDYESAACGLPLLRLPNRLVPNHYDLLMMPNLTSLTFEGAIQIDLDVRGDNRPLPGIDGDSSPQAEERQVGANQIVLHADDSLRIDNIWFRDLGAASGARGANSAINNLTAAKAAKAGYVDVSGVCRDPQYQLLVITLAKDLRPHTMGQLYLTFAGSLSEDMRGFYRSSTNPSGNQTLNKWLYMATTQFQATEARRAFPCFDEPALKATFDVSLLHEASLESRGNTERVYERVLARKGLLAQVSGAQKLVRFARTPPMSTYLVAFVVGQFDRVERQVVAARHPINISVLTPPGLAHQGAFALDTAARAYPLLEQFCALEMPASIKKMDLVAVRDFEAGAMENWGLITFKDSQLLVDARFTSPVGRALVGGTVVHELAHQWFGNMVTMGWWNELWLNEGFATWLEHHLMDQLYPELEFTFQYLIDSHIIALNYDSLRVAHAVRPDAASVSEPQEIDDIFDPISYNKAAAIIRSLHDDYMRPEPFTRAIRQYLAARKYSTATSEDLWHYMELAQQQQQALEPTNNFKLPSVRSYLKSWITQPGHPLIRAHLLTTSGSDTRLPRLELSQTRFLTNVAALSDDERQQRWLVHVKVLISDGNNKRQQVLDVIMNDDDSSDGTTVLNLPSWFDARPASGHWIKLNANFTGFYRTLYPADLFARFGEPVRGRYMGASDRINLVDETHALVLANQLGMERLVEMLSWFANEDHGAVLESAVTAYQALLRLFEADETSGDPEGLLRRKLLLFGKRVFGSMYGRQLPANYLPANNDSTHMLEMGRAAVSSLLVQIGHELALDEAVRTFEEAVAPGAGEPPAHLRGAYYTAIARNGSEAQHRKLVAKLDELESRAELARLANALAKAERQPRIARLWQWLRASASSGGQVDRIDVVSAILQAGAVGRQFVRRLLEESPDELVTLNGGKPVTSLIEEFCIAAQTEPLSELSGLFARQSNLIDWGSSRDYIKRMRDWQSMLRTSGAKRLEAAIDHYLEKEAAAAVSKTTTTTTTSAEAA